MKNKQIIRLTESDLHRIVKESVNMVLNEGFFDKMKSRFGKKPQPKKIEQPEASMSEYDKELERIKDKYGIGGYAQLSPHDLAMARKELEKKFPNH